MRDCAPEIFRRRVVIEGNPNRPVAASEVRSYLMGLSEALGLEVLLEPVVHHSDDHGEAGWIRWAAAGAHFYAWDRPCLFFSVDLWLNSQVSLSAAAAFTRAFFGLEQVEATEV